MAVRRKETRRECIRRNRLGGKVVEDKVDRERVRGKGSTNEIGKEPGGIVTE